MNEYFCRFARWVAQMMGHPFAFAAAVFVIVAWAAVGPTLHYSESWQLLVNTGTTILTFLMVFLVQNTQSRDSRAAQVKLDELLRAVKGARTELVNLENLSEVELTRYCNEFQDLHLHYAKVLKKRGKHIELNAAVAEVSTAQKRRLSDDPRKPMRKAAAH